MQFERSSDSFVDELNIFSLPKTETSIVRSEYIEYRPCSQISQTGPIDFCLTTQENQYIDLKRSLLKVNFVVTDDVSAKPALDVDILAVNNLLHSLWSQVDIYLNQTLVSPCNNNYPYKAYFDNVLQANFQNNNVQKAEMWFNDDIGLFDSTDVGSVGTNTARRQRHYPLVASQGARIVGPLLADLNTIDRWILPGVDINIRLWQTSNEFRLMKDVGVTANFVLKFTDVVFMPNIITVKPSITDAHLSLLNSGQNAKYPFFRHQVHAYNVPSGSTFFRQDQIFQNEKPDRVIIGIVNAEAYQGNLQKNPFNFQDYNIKSIDFTVNDKSLNGRPLDVKTDEFQEVFYNVTSYTNKEKINGPAITLQGFQGGYAIYIFDEYAGLKKPHKSVSDIRQGFSKLIINFSQALSETATVVVYGIFNDVFEIDKYKKVLVQ